MHWILSIAAPIALAAWRSVRWLEVLAAGVDGLVAAAAVYLVFGRPLLCLSFAAMVVAVNAARVLALGAAAGLWRHPE